MDLSAEARFYLYHFLPALQFLYVQLVPVDLSDITELLVQGELKQKQFLVSRGTAWSIKSPGLRNQQNFDN